MNNETSGQPVLQARQLVKQFADDAQTLTILHGIDLTVQRGELVSIVGSSGSGKSTLLHLLGGLELPTSGEVWLNGQSLSEVNETRRGQLRNRHIGFVYQFHHLLPEFSALENVALPLIMRSEISVSQARQQAARMLELVGLGHRLTHRPAELSGGERQRVAMARALVIEPDIVLADEPTGNLDRQNAQSIMTLLQTLRRDLGMAMLIVTHDEQLAQAADRCLKMQDGLFAG